MKKPILKALAAGLAITMAFSSPVTALAEGISGIFAPAESTGNSNSRSKTNTNSGVEDFEDKKDIAYNVVGVAFDKDVVDLEVSDKDRNEALLSAVILIDNSEDLAQGTESKRSISVQELADYEDLILTFDGNQVTADQLYKYLTFYEDVDYCRTQDGAYPSEKGKDGYYFDKDGNFIPRVNLQMPYYDKEGKLHPAAGTDTADTCKVGVRLNEKKPDLTPVGTTYVSVKLGKEYKATAKVNVKNYNMGIGWNTEKADGYQKHIYDMNEYLDNPGNLAVTWRAYTKNKNGKETAYKTITAEGGKLTLAKIPGNDKIVYVMAVAENGKTVSKPFEMKVWKGIPITKLTKTAPTTNTVNRGTAEGTDKDEVTLKLTFTTGTVKTGDVPDGVTETTDEITWTSGNGTIAEVIEGSQEFDKGKKEGSVKIRLTGGGRVTVTAKATSGRSLKYSLKVTADFEAFEEPGVTLKPGTLYPGQSAQIIPNTKPANTTSKISYIIVDADPVEGKAGEYTPAGAKEGKFTAENPPKKARNANASVSKNMLKASATKNEEKHYFIVASAQKGTGRSKVTVYSTPVLFSINKSSVIGASIVYSEKEKIDGALDGKTIELNIGKTLDLDALLDTPSGITIEKTDMQEMVTWSTNKAKVATIDQNGKVTPIAPGKAKITLSAVGKKDAASDKVKNHKAIVNITVKQPATAIALKKSVNTVTVPTKSNGTNVTLQVNKYTPVKSKEVISWTITKSTIVGTDGKNLVTIKCGSGRSAVSTTEVNKKLDNFKNGMKQAVSAKCTVNIPKDAPLGGEVTIVAEAASGAKTKATIKVCSKTDKIIVKGSRNGTGTSAKKDLKVGEILELNGNKDADKGIFTVTSKEEKPVYEEMTYTVSKKGLVNIVGSKVYPTSDTGTVRITATTPSGKKATLTVTLKPAEPSSGK